VDLAPELLAEALDPRSIVATRIGPGGAAPEPMKAMIAECRELLAGIEAWRNATSQRLSNAETGLLSLAHRMLVPPEEKPRGETDLGTWGGWKDSADLDTRAMTAETTR
jgi:hypothetical protein